tara:strand:- start:209 stop:349 length:141 start_codon:yes stop_codon:yes gene_type:complete
MKFQKLIKKKLDQIEGSNFLISNETSPSADFFELSIEDYFQLDITF